MGAFPNVSLKSLLVFTSFSAMSFWIDCVWKMGTWACTYTFTDIHKIQSGQMQVLKNIKSITQRSKVDWNYKLFFFFNICYFELNVYLLQAALCNRGDEKNTWRKWKLEIFKQDNSRSWSCKRNIKMSWNSHWQGKFDNGEYEIGRQNSVVWPRSPVRQQYANASVCLEAGSISCVSLILFIISWFFCNGTD